MRRIRPRAKRQLLSHIRQLKHKQIFAFAIALLSGLPLTLSVCGTNFSRVATPEARGLQGLATRRTFIS